MKFDELVKKFSRAVEKHDGKALASLFTPNGVYHDTFYGEFKGRAAIDKMLDVFYREEFNAGFAFSQLGMPGSLMEKVYGKWARQLLAVPSAAKVRAKLGK